MSIDLETISSPRFEVTIFFPHFVCVALKSPRLFAQAIIGMQQHQIVLLFSTLYQSSIRDLLKYKAFSDTHNIVPHQVAARCHPSGHLWAIYQWLELRIV